MKLRGALDKEVYGAVWGSTGVVEAGGLKKLSGLRVSLFLELHFWSPNPKP